jgi:hypothetical protein
VGRRKQQQQQLQRHSSRLLRLDVLAWRGAPRPQAQQRSRGHSRHICVTSRMCVKMRNRFGCDRSVEPLLRPLFRD